MFHHVIFLSPILGSVAPSFQSRHARRSLHFQIHLEFSLSRSTLFLVLFSRFDREEREREREAELADQREEESKCHEGHASREKGEKERRVCKYFPRRDSSPGKEKGDPLFGVRSIVGIRENYRIAEEKRGRYRDEASERENNGRSRMGGWRWDAL